MEPEGREPCTQCGESIALTARLCHHCNRSALVSLGVEPAAADGRQRYQVARALAALGAPFPAPPAITAALAEGRQVAAGLTRAQAYAADEALQAFGLRASLEGAAGARSGAMKTAAIAAALVAGLALAGWWMMRPRAAAPAARAGDVVPVGVAAAAPASAPELPRGQIVKMALASTASVRCSDSVGAGFFVADGLLLTNAHVLCGDGSPVRVVLADGRETSGQTVRRDDDLDLALVNASGLGAPALAMGDAGAMGVGDRVLLAGSPVGMDFTVHEGMVSALGRAVLGTAYIQLDAKVNPGNSGGPLIDTHGRVVGIVSLKRTDAEGIALALPINYAYAGASPMVEPPAGASSAGFEALVAQAQKEDEKLAGAVGDLEMRPLLAGVGMGEHGEYLAQVLQPAHGYPPYQEFKVKVWSGDTELCSMTTSISEWKAVDEAGRGNPRLQAWLGKHGLQAQLYAGRAPVRLDLCPADQMRSGVQLELLGADPSAARLTLR